MATRTPAAGESKKLPITLRAFSQWLDWVAGGKVGTPPTGDDAPAGELYQSLVLESVAKSMIKPLEADKDRALAWMAYYEAEKGVHTDPQVTGEYQFRRGAPVRVPSKIKINADRLKSRYPQLHAQSRDWTPYRSVALAETLKAPPAPQLDDALPAPTPEAVASPKLPVSWGTAFTRYQARLEELKGHKKVAADAVDVMGNLLTAEAVKAEYEKFWNGHGVLEFECGTKIQLDRMQFSQERAAEVLEIAKAVNPDLDLSTIVEEVPEHETEGSRRLVKINYEAHGEAETTGLGNPFEGE